MSSPDLQSPDAKFDGSRGNSLRSFFRVLLVDGRSSWLVRLGLLILVVHWGAASVYYIPSASMEPTLHGSDDWFDRDRVVVNKLAFGPRIPFSQDRLFHTGHPKRWDIVLINMPGAPKGTAPLIKRVVALPGEKVIVRNGSVLINGEVMPPPDSLKGSISRTSTLWVPLWKSNWKFLELARFVLHGDSSKRVESGVIFRLAPRRFAAVEREVKRLAVAFSEIDLSDLDSWGEGEVAAVIDKVHPSTNVLLMIRAHLSKAASSKNSPMYGTETTGAETVVPEGTYFLLGDNGPESIDSRYYGWVDEDAFIGRAFAIVYPLHRIRDLSGFTHRRSGQAILGGIIVLLILWECVPAFWAFNWRVRRAVPALGWQENDRILVHRWPLGVYIPGVRRWVRWRDALHTGDSVFFWADAQRRNLTLGRIAEQMPDETYRVELVSEDASRTTTVSRNAMVGMPGRVWYPFRRGFRRDEGNKS